MNRGKEKVKIIINFFDAYANINLKELSILEKEYDTHCLLNLDFLDVITWGTHQITEAFEISNLCDCLEKKPLIGNSKMEDTYLNILTTIVKRIEENYNQRSIPKYLIKPYYIDKYPNSEEPLVLLNGEIYQKAKITPLVGNCIE